jgi:hypothetical protein
MRGILIIFLSWKNSPGHFSEFSTNIICTLIKASNHYRYIRIRFCFILKLFFQLKRLSVHVIFCKPD